MPQPNPSSLRELERVVSALGHDLYRNDPIVRNALQHIAHGVPTERLLFDLIGVLATDRQRLLEVVTDATMRTIPRPLLQRNNDNDTHAQP